MDMSYLPEGLHPVLGAANDTTALTTGVCNPINLEEMSMLYIVVAIQHAGSGAAVLQPEMKSGSGGTLTAVTATMEIWSNDNTATSSMTKETAGTSYTCTADANNVLVVFRVDPASLITNTAGAASTRYNYVGLYVSGGGSSSDEASVLYLCELKHKRSVANIPDLLA